MEELNKRNYYLHSQINLLLKWSITMRAEQKNASRQLFKDIWLFDIELLHRYHQPAQRSLRQCLHSRHHYPRCSLELRCLLSTALGPMDAQSQDFDAPTESMTSLTPLLEQSGYITIKGYDKMFDSYKLDIPNHEVELGLMRSLIPYYITPDTLTTNNTE